MAVIEAPKPAPESRFGPSGPSIGVGVLSLAGMEMRAGIRGPSFRLLTVVAAVIGWSAGGAPGHGVALSAWVTGEAAWRYIGFVVIAWMSVVAVQDAAARTDVLVYSKPQPTERIVLSRFLAAFGQILLALAAMYVFAVLSRLYAGGGLLGFPAYFSRFALSAGVVFFVGAASYTLAVLARTPLAGAVAGLYWILALAGKSYLPKAVFPSYSQNLLGYIYLGVFLISIACWFHRRSRRGTHAVGAAVWLSAVVSLSLCVATVLHGLATEHDPMVHQNPTLDMMSSQNATLGELAPGFRLPDANGDLASLADYPGKIFIIALWSPSDAESTIVLDRLEQIWEQYGSRGVQPVAICLSEDRAAAGIFARGANVHYPVVHDWGTHNAEKTSETSPMATAYEANSLPHVVITDRRRKIRHILLGVDAYEGNALERAITERLSVEPE